jgi:predicted LPLAT superfamily acyltransferase
VTPAWLERPEGGSALVMRLYAACALGLGRAISRLVLLPITAYFLLRRGPERRASRAYLARALGRPATWLDVGRHFHTFAGVTLDRVYFLAGQLRRFDTHIFGLEELHRVMDFGHGVLLVGAHAGSFDALRALSLERPDVTVRVVLDAEHSPALSAILKQLNPQMAASIINPRQDGTAVALAIGAALGEGALVTMLADRGRPGNPTVAVDFLGRPAEFPTAPWQIAAALHVPVVLCIGLYRGGNRYDLHFAVLTEKLQIERRQRQQQLRVAIQGFADRLASLISLAPYNWFNFYDFWNELGMDPRTDDARDDSAAASDGHAARR